jgi:dynein heavy chain
LLAAHSCCRYLENIFASADIQAQLPRESKLLFGVDISWKEIMRRTNDHPNCVVAGTHPGLKELLHKHNISLEHIQKSLEQYLETKRLHFPRFYFLSNDELLQLLTQCRDPQAVQPHLRKCFEGLNELLFGNQPGLEERLSSAHGRGLAGTAPAGTALDIRAMCSSQGEVICFSRQFKARNDVEVWLSAVEANMQQTMHKLLRLGVLL